MLPAQRSGLGVSTASGHLQGRIKRRDQTSQTPYFRRKAPRKGHDFTAIAAFLGLVEADKPSARRPYPHFALA